MSKYFKRNYVDVLQIITPDYYKGEDFKKYGTEEDLVSKILSSEIELIKDNFFIDALEYSPLSGLLNYNASFGYCRDLPNYLIKQNNLTKVTFSEFDLAIMKPLGYNIEDYATSSEFAEFLSGTLFEAIGLGEDSTPNNVYAKTSGAYGDTESESHQYLLESLGLFHILNYSKSGSSRLDYRTLIVDLFATKLYSGQDLVLSDAIKILKEGIWNSWSTYKDVAFFKEFVEGTTTYTSGTQSLEKMKTWADVMYNESYSNKDDVYIRDSMENFIDNNDVPEDMIPAGPFYKFQRAVGFMMADINEQVVSLDTLHSIEDCPVEYLPYLADLIGWEFYTSNDDAWRRQLRSAVSLYKQKGTKAGLENLIKVILPSFDLDFDSQYSEFYESYLPNLLYYLLKTESSVLSSLEVWDNEKASLYANGERDPSNLDNSIRLLVDNILLSCVERFPLLFMMRGYDFDLQDPSFMFNFRGRNFPIPPWEYEKYYKDCAITEELADFLKDTLTCLGINATYLDSFYDFILDNSTRNVLETKYYDNGFLFLTSSLNLPPNYESIMSNFEREKFDYIPLWSGKSSRFDLTLSSTNIDTDFFAPGAFDREDFFASLEAIPKFVPAKAIPRNHIDLTLGERQITYVALAPRVNGAFMDAPEVSGAIGGFQLCSLDMRSDKAALKGVHHYPSYDDSKSEYSHQDLPVFKRNRTLFRRKTDSISSNYDLSGDIFTLSGDFVANWQGRNAIRRRDFGKILWKGDWYNRTGFNQPSYLNKGAMTGAGETQDYAWGLSGYIPLGFQVSSYSFENVTNFFDLPGVWESCENVNSSGEFNGVNTSATFEIRGTSEIEPHDGHKYRYRDDINDVPRLIYELLKKEIDVKTQKFIERNPEFFKFNNWKNFYDRVFSIFWEDIDLNERSFYDFGFGKYIKRAKVHSIKGIPYIYENYFAKSGYDQNTAYSLLESYINGGSNILSRIYGPFLFNGLLTVDGSAIGTTSTNGKNVNIYDKIEVSLSDTGDFISASTEQDLAINGSEQRAPYYLSGVELCYRRQDTPNKISLFSLSDNGSLLPEDAAILENNMLGVRCIDNDVRLRYSFDYGDADVFFEPEHDFKLDIKSVFLKDKGMDTGGRGYGVWIHTEPETLPNGKKVFWNYMPNGKWEMRYATEVTSTGSLKNCILNFFHNVQHPNKSLSIDQMIDCYATDDNFSTVWNIRNEDLVEDTLRFNTFNQPIKVPLDYYKVNQQVHREDQKYVIEILPYGSIDSKDIWLYDGISVVDQTLKDYSYMMLEGFIDDYNLENIPTQDLVRFFKEDGSQIPLSSSIYVDGDGNMSFEGDKVTAALAMSPATYATLAKPKLYSQISASSMKVTYDNGKSKPNEKYVGILRQDAYDNNFSVDNILVRPKTRGSHIRYNYSELSELSPVQFLEVMSFMKAQGSSEFRKGRDNRKPTAGPDGFYGGTRINYRDIVIGDRWDQALFEEAQRYDDIFTVN